jgi:hypothetical protein
LNFFPDRVKNAVLALSKNPLEDYMSFIKRCSLNCDASVVKMADLLDNMDLTRLSRITERDIDRNIKYMKAYQYLRNS